MLPVISVNACVVANPSLLSRFMSCSPEDPLPGRSAAFSGQLVIESFYSSLRVAVIVCPLRAADLPGSGSSELQLMNRNKRDGLATTHALTDITGSTYDELSWIHYGDIFQ